MGSLGHRVLILRPVQRLYLWRDPRLRGILGSGITCQVLRIAFPFSVFLRHLLRDPLLKSSGDTNELYIGPHEATVLKTAAVMLPTYLPHDFCKQSELVK